MSKKYLLGLSGHRLRAAQLWAVIMPAYILFGYNQSVAGALLSLPSWVATFPQIDTSSPNLSPAQLAENSRLQGTTVAMYTLGCFFGALSCIYLGERLGRISVIQLGSVLHIVGATLQASSFSLGQLIVGRLISGLGFGALSATAPNWQSECSQASHRGAVRPSTYFPRRKVIMESLFISAGLALAAWIDLGMSFALGSVSWRFPLALSAVFAIVTIVTASRLPESPRWLLKAGRTDAARESLAALEGCDENDEIVTEAISEIVESLAIAGNGRFTDCFKNGELRLLNRTCLACAGQVFQQILAFYLSTVFENYLGLSGLQSRIVAGSVFTFQALCSPVGVLTVDRLGRRKLMMISAFGMGGCMAIMAGCGSQPNNIAAVAVAGAMIFLFSFFFPIGFLGLTFLYASEISPLSARVQITSLSTACAWCFNFLVTEVTPTGFASLKWRYFIIFARINLFLTLPAVYYFFPETSSRHLEEVDQIFRDSKTAVDPPKVAKKLTVHALLDAESASGSPLVGNRRTAEAGEQ